MERDDRPSSDSWKPMTVVRLPLVASVALLLSSCSGEEAIRRFTPKDADVRARAYLALLTRDQPDSAAARLVPRLSGPNARREIAKIAAVLKGQRFDSSRVIGAAVNSINGTRHVNLSYELHSASGWSVANVATVDSANTWFVEGVSTRALARPLEDEVRFTLRGKSMRHYAWLVMSILCLMFSLGTALFLAARRTMPKRWRWVLASLIGIGAFSLNWTTGVAVSNPYLLQLGAASFTRAAPVAPWIISFGIPIGAIAALQRYQRWRAESSRPVEPSPAAPEADPEQP